MTTRGLREIFGRRRLHFNGKRRGGGLKGGLCVEAERERAREREGGLAQRGAAWWHGVGAVVTRPRRAQAARCRTTVESGGVGATRSTWLTGGPGRDGDPVVSVWVWRGAAR
jgi:hypothetical protein